MNGIFPRNSISLKKNNSSSYNEGVSHQYMNGYENGIYKQQNVIIKQGLPSPLNQLTFFNRASKALVKPDVQNGFTQYDKIKQTERSEYTPNSNPPERTSSKLMRKSCIVKDEKTGLTFSTLYVSKFIRRIKAVSSIMRFKEMGQSQFRIIQDPSCDYKYYFMKGAFQSEAPSVFDKFYHKLQSNYLNLIEEKFNIFMIFLKDSHAWKLFSAKYCSLFQYDSLKILILPNSFTRLIWISFLFFIILINLVYTPLKYSFELQDYGNYKWFVFYLPQIAFISEIVLTFFTENQVAKV